MNMRSDKFSKYNLRDHCKFFSNKELGSFKIF